VEALFRVKFRGIIIKRALTLFFSTLLVVFYLFPLFVFCAHHMLVLLLAALVLLLCVGVASHVGAIVIFWVGVIIPHWCYHF
jgi:hypothetical protein